MAYKADIQLAVKGLRELRSLNIHLDRNGKAVDRSIEKIMKYNSVTRSHFVPTLNNLSSSLAKAALFNALLALSIFNPLALALAI